MSETDLPDKEEVPLYKELLSIYEDFETEDQPDRETLLSKLRRLDLYWSGVQDIYFNSEERKWDEVRTDELTPRAKIVNVYRAFLESIIAALSAALPANRFFPKNADNPIDISTAKGYSKISDLIQLQNDAPLLLTKALFILCNQTFVAAYNHYETSFDYGNIKVPIEGPVEQEVTNSYCPQCMSEVEPQATIDGLDACPDCGNSDLVQDVGIEVIQDVIGEEDYPAGKETIDLYGPLNVKIAQYATDQASTPYLCLETDHHYTQLMSWYPEYRDYLSKAAANIGDEGREARKSHDTYTMESPIKTLKRVWMRPCTFEAAKEVDLYSELKQQFTKGVLLHIVDGKIIRIEAEELDAHWTLSESPISKHVHADPIGSALVDVQDMTTDMVNLTLDSIRFGIPMTFVEANAIDWNKFKQTKAVPGSLYPTKTLPGKTIKDAFFTPNTATLSQEVDKFNASLMQMGQFVSGAFPATYGGPQVGGSGTYREYELSRNQALQRLSLPWKMIQQWWRKTMRKASKEYRANMIADEAFAQEIGGSFVNVWIRRSELRGEIGEVEAEVSDQFPISSIQKRGLLLELMQMGSPELNSVIFSAGNANLISRLLGFQEIEIPGEADRTKQLYTILDLIKQEPIIMGIDPISMQPMYGPSIPAEPDIDNSAICIETTRAWLVSEIGREVKELNPIGYQNVMLNLQQHLQVQAMQEQQMMMAQMQQQAPQTQPVEDKQVPGEPPVKEPAPKDKGAEIRRVK